MCIGTSPHQATQPMNHIGTHVGLSICESFASSRAEVVLECLLSPALRILRFPLNTEYCIARGCEYKPEPRPHNMTPSADMEPAEGVGVLLAHPCTR